MVTFRSYVSLPEGTWVQSLSIGAEKSPCPSVRVCSGRRHQKPAFLGAQDWQICCIRFEIHGSMCERRDFQSRALSHIILEVQTSRIFYICKKTCFQNQIAAWTTGWSGTGLGTTGRTPSGNLPVYVEPTQKGEKFTRIRRPGEDGGGLGWLGHLSHLQRDRTVIYPYFSGISVFFQSFWGKLDNY